MRWLLIARKDFGDAVRERELYTYAGLFAILGIGLGYVIGGQTFGGPSTGPAALSVVPAALLLSYLGPLVALMESQGSIVSKRLAGELKVLLGLPFSRRSLVVGTFLGRTGLVLASLSTALVTSTVVVILRGGPVAVRALLVTFALLGVLSVAFVAIGVGVSALSRTTTWSATLAFSAFLAFAFRVWDFLPEAVVYAVNGFSMPRSMPAAATAFDHLDPMTAYGNALAGLVPEIRPVMGFVGTRSDSAITLQFYEHPPVALAFLAAWIALPLLVGYWRLSRVDL